MHIEPHIRARELNPTHSSATKSSPTGTKKESTPLPGHRKRKK
jgi:hypothetical protein